MGVQRHPVDEIRIWVLRSETPSDPRGDGCIACTDKSSGAIGQSLLSKLIPEPLLLKSDVAVPDQSELNISPSMPWAAMLW